MPDAAPIPRFIPIWLACRCGYQWDDWQPVMVPVETWAAHVRTIRCPKCSLGRRNLMLRFTPLEHPDA